jgi:hypothetical protein
MLNQKAPIAIARMPGGTRWCVAWFAVTSGVAGRGEDGWERGTRRRATGSHRGERHAIYKGAGAGPLRSVRRSPIPSLVPSVTTPEPCRARRLHEHT